MLNITFRVFSPILGKWYTNHKTTKTLADFRLYARSLYSGNWEIIEINQVRG